ncbi:MAG TPA: diacylglycerol kinase family protein [Humisphaera sp.]
MKCTRALVLLNKRSGTLAFSDRKDEGERIAAGLRAHGIDADVRFIDPRKIPQEIASGRSGGCTAVLVGGGDGTVNAVANAVAGDGTCEPLPLAVLPLGTHNHFSQELGIPDDLEAAVSLVGAALAGGDGVRPLDVAEVNGRVFLNFSGVGLHPHVVERREAEHASLKRFALLRTVLHKFTKPLAFALAFVRSLGDLPVLRVVLTANGRRLPRVTPCVVVGTNLLQIERFGLADVSAPQRDVLNVYVAKASRLSGILRLILAAATRQLRRLREFEAIATTELTIHYRRPTLKATLDGEVVRLRTPLRYKVRKGGLLVVAPATGGAAAAAGKSGKPDDTAAHPHPTAVARTAEATERVASLSA